MIIALISVLSTFLALLAVLFWYASHEMKVQSILLLDLTASLKSTLTTITYQKGIIEELAKKLTESYGVSTYNGDIQ